MMKKIGQCNKTNFTIRSLSNDLTKKQRQTNLTIYYRPWLSSNSTLNGFRYCFYEGIICISWTPNLTRVEWKIIRKRAQFLVGLWCRINHQRNTRFPWVTTGHLIIILNHLPRRSVPQRNISVRFSTFPSLSVHLSWVHQEVNLP